MTHLAWQASRRPIIAIDGPTASGKGTLAQRLAAELGFAHLDSGLLYRAVAAKLLRTGQSFDSPAQAANVAQRIETADLEAADLREETVAQGASKVAAIPEVRRALLDIQRNFAANPPPVGGRPAAGAVLDGRDIGTVICPEADVKLFITASTEVRAQRRYRELQARGRESIYEQVLEDMKIRDARDRQRPISPLKAAPDAFEIDSSNLTADEVLKRALEVVQSQIGTEAMPVRPLHTPCVRGSRP